MNENEAKELWLATLDFVHDHGEVMNHGNSGEFHNDGEYSETLRKADDSLLKLASEFVNKTGYLPVNVGPRYHEDVYDFLNHRWWMVIRP